MSLLKTITGDIARALGVLAMLFMLVGAAPPDTLGGGSVIQQASALGTAYGVLCGSDHDPGALACHAPTNCCRPDHLALPPRQEAADPAYVAAIAVVYGAMGQPSPRAVPPPPFRSRAPPA